MRKYFSLISIISLLITLLILWLGVGKNTGNIGTAILVAGVSLSFITAVFSKKGTLKTVSIVLVSSVIGIYSIFIIAFIMGLVNSSW